MTGLDPTRPFVLLDDARTGGRARLFTGIGATIVATTPAEVRPALYRLRAAGGERAGFIGHEAGAALEPALAGIARIGDDGVPLLWFGCFDSVAEVDVATLIDPGPARIGRLEPGITEAAHAAMVARIAALIAAGDIYQANLTFAATVEVAGHPLALYRHLRDTQRAAYGALIHTGAAWVLSFSPELFFTLDAGRLTARPMKGTAPRGATADEDDAAAAALAADPKNRAENLMIVDLLRNDLARVALPGSVAVPYLFTVERYPTLLQMTSTITATTAADPVTVLETLFPCGSITGAPKIRAMLVIAEVEAGPRGLYTGSIGSIGANGDAAFNVAIRTLVMTARGHARIGIGSGIVADSIAADEWRECLAKAAFLARGPAPDLIETMRCDDGRVALLDRHLDRLAASARFLGYAVDIAEVRAQVEAAAIGSARLRLLVSPRGGIAVQHSPLPEVPPREVEIALVPLPVAATDWRLRHKTTDRAFYDEARRAAGAFEVVFVRDDGRITEGSFTNVFVARDGILLTPPLGNGLLPGVLRGAMVDDGRAVEAPLTVDDLAGGCLIGNSVRGLIVARCRAR